MGSEWGEDMKQFDFLVRIAMPQMRSLPDEYNSSKACNDADPCATVRQRVHRISLAAPLDAQARSKVQTGLSPRLSPHLMGALHRDAMEVPARAARRQRDTGHSLYDRVQSLCQMGR